MICERPYFNTIHEAHTDPADVCFSCDGRGCRRWRSPDSGWTHEVCIICGGLATGGRFVVHLVSAKGWRYEMRFVSEDFLKAKYRAERLAAHLAGGSVPVAEIRVIYKPADRDQVEQVVHTVPVPAPEHERAVA